jgi:hypothetical protein
MFYQKNDLKAIFFLRSENWGTGQPLPRKSNGSQTPVVSLFRRSTLQPEGLSGVGCHFYCLSRSHNLLFPAYFASGSRMINSSCGFGKSPGQKAARLRARVIASQATPA